ncbi:MAG: type III pantothenate kinase [Bacteroidota bacterium]|nr:type III pantothenate kinase [Bacteroidota bacterium]
MNLAIDIGNFSCKAAVYSQEKKEYITYTDNPDNIFFEAIIDEFPVKKVILSTVRKGDTMFTDILRDAGIETLILNHKTALPFILQYESPETIGTDRIAAVAGAHNMFSDSNVLVIDAGTAVTYDLLGSENTYLGGNISPGLAMRFRALNEFTSMLPLVSKGDSFGNLGVNTTDAIRSGVQTGLIFEINNYLRTLKKKYRKLTVIITGGDGAFLTDKLEAGHILVPDLVVDGLNYILNYNA